MGEAAKRDAGLAKSKVCNQVFNKYVVVVNLEISIWSIFHFWNIL